MNRVIVGCWNVMPHWCCSRKGSADCQIWDLVKYQDIVRIYCWLFYRKIHQCVVVETLTWSCLPLLACSSAARFIPIIQVSCLDFCITDVFTVTGFLWATFPVGLCAFCGNGVFAFIRLCAHPKIFLSCFRNESMNRLGSGFGILRPEYAGLFLLKPRKNKT